MKKLISRLVLTTLIIYGLGALPQLWATEPGKRELPPRAVGPLATGDSSPVTGLSGGGCCGGTSVVQAPEPPPPVEPPTPVAEKPPETAPPPKEEVQPPPSSSHVATRWLSPDEHPKLPTGVCHDYVGERIGMPPPQNGVRRTAAEVTSFLQDPKNHYQGPKNYTPGTPEPPLPPGTVIQLGGAHVGIVYPDGKIHHYTQAAPSLGIKAQPNVSNSITELVNTKRTWQDGQGNTVVNYPYKNQPVRVWVPKSTP
ncbi:MAG: hypothetical protein PHW74_11380 [Desulfobacca sp.]|nr:hypothetical protein [Desulfobacca sp.]